MGQLFSWLYSKAKFTAINPLLRLNFLKTIYRIRFNIIFAFYFLQFQSTPHIFGTKTLFYNGNCLGLPWRILDLCNQFINWHHICDLCTSRNKGKIIDWNRTIVCRKSNNKTKEITIINQVNLTQKVTFFILLTFVKCMLLSRWHEDRIGQGKKEFSKLESWIFFETFAQKYTKQR